MANLIKRIKGGYELIGTSQFIPASNLIPFGTLGGFPGNIKNGTFISATFYDEIKKNASDYVKGTNADFGELFIHVTTKKNPFDFLFGYKTQYKAEGKIQLYVVNKATTPLSYNRW